MRDFFTRQWFVFNTGIRIRYLSVIIFLAISCLFNSNVQAQAQARISLHMNEVEIGNVLTELEKQTGKKFIYRDDQLDASEKVSINVDSVSLVEALIQLLHPKNISFKIHESESRVTLRKNPNRSQNSEVGDRPLFTVSGTVIDEKSKAGIAGVNIIIKGTASGTTTDAEGKFALEAGEKDVLVFSFIGFVSFETVVGDKTIIDVTMSEDARNLEEVTVHAGYYDVDSKELTGNIGRMSSKQIASQPVLNPLQAMQGRIAGVQVQQYSGIPGDAFIIQVRGMNSIRGQTANEPLYLIDGVPFSSATMFSAGGGVIRGGTNPLNSINPSDIESIEVLKDADATAIYGSRGSNGVVLITTKKGKSGKTKVDLNIYTGIGSMGRQMDMLNTSQYVRMRKEAFKNDGVTPTISNAPDLLVWDTTRQTDWRKELLGGTAKITNAQASISGGNASTQFLFGGGYLKQTTVFPGDYNYQKGSMHFNISHSSLDSKFLMNFSTSFVIDQNVLPTTDFTGLVYSLTPNSPQIYNPDGSLNWSNGTWNNPYGDMRRSYTAKTRNLISNLTLSYEVAKGLKLKLNTGLNYLNTNERSITPIAAQNPAFNPTGSSNTTTGSITSWIAEPQIEYQKAVGGGRLSALLGTTFQQSIRDKTGYFASGFINDTQLENPVAAATVTPSGVEYSEYKYHAVFGRINYAWKEKYILNLTGRRDGSSRFGPNRQFANFGAVGAAWIFSSEDFIKNFIPGLSFGKLRGSFGVTGSDQIGDYQYLDTHTSTQYTYQGGKGLYPTRLYNPDYSWEENKKIEGGIELGFFNDRLAFSASYYHNRSSNQLVGYTLPAVAGFTSIQSNLPAVIQNTGLEIVVSNLNIRRGSFSWSSSLNVTLPTNRLVSYPNIEGSSYANTYAVDKSLFVVKKYKSLGVDPQTGLYSFEDVDNNGVLSTAVDAQFLKQRTFDYYGGLQNTITVGNFELQFFFQFVKQVGFNYLYSIGLPPGYRGNQPTLVLERWQRPGDITDVQRYTQGGVAATAFGNAISNGDGILSDASFIRLQNASLSWTMPAAVSGKIRAEKVRLYVQGQNLFVITDYNGSDPEPQNVKSLSPLRMMTIGAQLTF
ncbi:MAG: SusC/RagA family TonB-linked outer membrane protein [Cyclobacteriaceae bacterium]|nr:SusC/RagA family TonB-linked outer membrane protein [Cyclobacteriaceae bacterium]